MSGKKILKTCFHRQGRDFLNDEGTNAWIGSLDFTHDTLAACNERKNILKVVTLRESRADRLTDPD